jgi:hypothetical protein
MERIGWDLKVKSAQIFKNNIQVLVAETNKTGWFLWLLDMMMVLKELEADLMKIIGNLIALHYRAINRRE